MSIQPDDRPLPFRGAVIDRAADVRHDPGALTALLGRGDARAVAVADAHVLVEADGERLARLPWDGDGDGAILLGVEDGRPLLLVDLSDAAEDDLRRMSLRDAGVSLDGAESGLAAYAVALAAWHARHGFCSVCGARSVLSEAGLARRCPACGASHFPRTDPVVIMSVEHDGRLLLGSRTGWPADRYSVLAGFVASGETPEEAVVREVAEESGVTARDPVYVTAQPWPFPASLMLGFHAISDGDEPAPGADGELSDVRWFSREEVVAMQSGDGPLQLPGPVSIARWLIDRWVDGTLGG